MYKSINTNDVADMALLSLEEESGEDTADDDQPGSSLPSSGGRVGSSSDGAIARRGHAPAAGGMKELAKDWVVVRTGDGRAKIVESKVWKSAKMEHVLRLLPDREKALYRYGQVFGGDVLFGDDVKDGRVEVFEALSVIHKQFDGKLWGLREEDVAPCVKSIPADILEPCCLDAFVEEYNRFRNWLRSLKGTVL